MIVRKIVMEDALEKDPQTPIFTCQPIIWSAYDMFQMKSILENLKILLIQFFWAFLCKVRML